MRRSTNSRSTCPPFSLSLHPLKREGARRVGQGVASRSLVQPTGRQDFFTIVALLLLLACAPVLEMSPNAADSRAIGKAHPLSAEQRVQGKLDLGGSAGLFVGVGKFDETSGLGDLRFTPDDAVLLAHLFVEELQLLPPANVRLALGGEPRSTRGREVLARLRQPGRTALAAGHV